MTYCETLFPDELVWDTVIDIIRKVRGEYDDKHGWDTDIATLKQSLPGVRITLPMKYDEIELHFPSDEAEMLFRIKYL